jgi:hypothetical protein
MAQYHQDQSMFGHNQPQPPLILSCSQIAKTGTNAPTAKLIHTKTTSFILTSTLRIVHQDYQAAIAHAIGFDKSSLFRGFFRHDQRTCMALLVLKHP